MPTTSEIMLGRMPMVSERREPYRIRENTSRPSSSVPMICSLLGASSFCSIWVL